MLSRLLVPSLCVCLFLSLVSGQADDPCTPNPCGENNRCSASFSGSSPILACECLIGYHQPVGGDPFGGCVADEEVEVVTTRIATTKKTTPPTTARPLVALLTTTQRQPAQSETRLQEGQRPAFLVPRKFGNAGVAPFIPTNVIDVDNKDNFPEDCLVHEDCEDSEFCNPALDEPKCVNACTTLTDVCGEGAICVTKLHRPVCVCPDGYEGSPYDKCKKTPSRVGMKFRKR